MHSPGMNNGEGLKNNMDSGQGNEAGEPRCSLHVEDNRGWHQDKERSVQSNPGSMGLLLLP